MLRMPKRDIGLWFSLDANRINARQGDQCMNQLEQWAQNGVIHLYMSEPAATEARKAGASKRHEKVLKFSPIMLTLADTHEEQRLLHQISDILFGRSPKDYNEENDVKIVFNAKKYPGPLITEDGDSKGQPYGILGKRTQLKTIGIDVWTTEQAIEAVRRKIKLRDEKARKVATCTGQPLPNWVSKD